MTEPVPFDELLSKIRSGGFSASVEGKTAIFYSGIDGAGVPNYRNAGNYQTAHAASTYTISETEVGVAIDRQVAVHIAAGTPMSSAQVDKLWEAASKPFAEQAAGHVKAFVDGASVGTEQSTKRAVFAQVELPELLRNAKVDTINEVPRTTLVTTFEHAGDRLEAARSVLAVVGPRSSLADTALASVSATPAEAAASHTRTVLPEAAAPTSTAHLAATAAMPPQASAAEPVPSHMRATVPELPPVHLAQVPAEAAAHASARPAASAATAPHAALAEPAPSHIRATPAELPSTQIVAPHAGGVRAAAEELGHGSARAVAGEAATTLSRNAETGLSTGVLRSGGHALEGAGRALGPLAVAADIGSLGMAYHADGNRVGDHTGRAASGIAGGWGGAIAGAEGGAALGAAAGSVVPVVGTAAGAAVGGVVGGVVGGIGGDWIGRRAYDRVKEMFSHDSGAAPAQHGPEPAGPTHAGPAPTGPALPGGAAPQGGHPTQTDQAPDHAYWKNVAAQAPAMQEPAAQARLAQAQLNQAQLAAKPSSQVEQRTASLRP